MIEKLLFWVEGSDRANLLKAFDKVNEIIDEINKKQKDKLDYIELLIKSKNEINIDEIVYKAIDMESISDGYKYYRDLLSKYHFIDDEISILNEKYVNDIINLCKKNKDEELRLSDLHTKELEKILDIISECKAHCNRCVPHAIEYIR